MKKIEKESSIPRYYQLAQILISKLKKMPAGSRLPSVQQLKKDYDLSQATIDKAFSILTKKGYTTTEKGKGTFVKELKTPKEILWVCGRDIFKDDISPYYTFSFQCCADELSKYEYNLTPQIWENKKTEFFDFAAYSNYSGYIFISCENSHPLLKYVKQKHLPYVHLSNSYSEYNILTNDFEQGLKLVREYFSDRLTHPAEYITVLGDNYCKEKTEAFYTSQPNKINFKFFGMELGTKIKDVTKAGYEMAKSIIAQNISLSSLFIMDDILALGVIKALLEMPEFNPDKTMLLIRGSGQILIPFAKPIPYLSIPPEKEAQEAVDMLMQRITRDKDIRSRLSQYSLLNPQKPNIASEGI